MKNLWTLYVENNLGTLSNLNLRYDRVANELRKVVPLHEAYKAAKCERTGGKDGERPADPAKLPLYHERERIFEVAALRFKRAALELLPLLHPLHTEAQFVRATVLRFRSQHNPNDEAAVEMACVAAAEDAYSYACSLYFEATNLSFNYQRGIVHAVNTTRGEPREYVLMKSAHTLTPTFTEEDRNQPPPYMTLKEVNLRGWLWELYADSVGGLGYWHNVVTGKSERIARPGDDD